MYAFYPSLLITWLNIFQVEEEKNKKSYSIIHKFFKL